MRVALGDPENLEINAVTNIGGHYRLAEFLDIDVHAFAQSITTLQQVPETSPRREKVLREAIALHTGRLADRPGLDDSWLSPHRRRTSRAGAQARMTLATILHHRDAALHHEEAMSLLREAARLVAGDRVLQDQVARRVTTLTSAAVQSEPPVPSSQPILSERSGHPDDIEHPEPRIHERDSAPGPHEALRTRTDPDPTGPEEKP